MNKIFFGILLSLLILWCESCGKENHDNHGKIVLKGIDNNSLTLIYPAKDTHLATIIEGDGSYKIECDNEQILIAKVILDNSLNVYCLELEALSVGEAIVTIKDKSNSIYYLKVIIKNLEYDYKVVECDAIVRGDKLSLNEQNTIRELALESIPVKVEGLYKFVFTDTDQTLGDVYLYTDQFMATRISGTFVREIKNKDDILATYQITIPENQFYNFDVIPYVNGTRSPIIENRFQFREDLTAKFKAEYPNIEEVYTIQAIILKKK